MILEETSFIVIDFETTGTCPPYSNDPWQVSWLLIENGSISINSIGESFLHVEERPVHPAIPGRYYEYIKQIQNAPSFLGWWSNISSLLLTHPIVAHNVSTEKTILTRLTPLHQYGPWLDTLQLTRALYPNLPSYTLSDLLDYFDLYKTTQSTCPDKSPHDALFDTVGCANLILFLLQQAPFSALDIGSLSRIKAHSYYERRKIEKR